MPRMTENLPCLEGKSWSLNTVYILRRSHTKAPESKQASWLDPNSLLGAYPPPCLLALWEGNVAVGASWELWCVLDLLGCMVGCPTEMKEADIAIRDSGITPPSSSALPMAWCPSHHTQKYHSKQCLEKDSVWSCDEHAQRLGQHFWLFSIPMAGRAIAFLPALPRRFLVKGFGPALDEVSIASRQQKCLWAWGI